MKTDCIETTAYNPQADGQSERTNQTSEITLSHLVNARQNDWVEVLGQIQMEHNNAINSSTNRAPNELMLGYFPRTAIVLPTPEVAENAKASGNTKLGITAATAIFRMRQDAIDALKFAEVAMALHVDRHHTLSSRQVGDTVYINIARKLDGGYSVAGINSVKLGPQRAGSFPILEIVGKNACRLGEHPTTWKIWPILSIVNLQTHQLEKIPIREPFVSRYTN